MTQELEISSSSTCQRFIAVLQERSILIHVPSLCVNPFCVVNKSWEETVKEKFEIWNNCLRNAVEEFTSVHQDSTVLFFSSFEAFDVFLNNPEQHEIETEDLRRSGGKVWVDHIHPTTKVHDYIANQVATFLGTVRSSSSLVQE
jgi:phospholipase/lecithinase/hemolysin